MKNYIIHVMWTMFASLPAWFAFKITDHVVNYWSVVLIVFSIQLAIAPALVRKGLND
jgi:hypothetical protein